MNPVPVQETHKAERQVYFVSKVFKGIEVRYKKIERLVLTVMVTGRKLIPYIQGHRVMIKTYYPIRQVLKKSNLTGRVIS